MDAQSPEEIRPPMAAIDREAIIRKWDDDIEALEKLDQDQVDPEGAVLLLGSSSIRRWEDAQAMLAPYPVIRRGYGGARYSDLVVFASRLIHPHQYSAVVIFVGNDIAGKDQDRQPEEVETWVRETIRVSLAHQPDAAVLLVEVTPTAKRFAVWPQIQELNSMLHEVAESLTGVHFVATSQHYLDSEGQPREQLFVSDRLHLNEDGYQIWASLIREKLDAVVPATVNRP
ncbi:MAG: GDSL-type esterase/lipase family protein [Planctomycetota bacterium]